ncbi:hypothetical protein BN1723_007304 [Verticillium longisporum]|uniref:Response regulatory domain-containing protein n=1 Tax=Verticillium longisporum TaxID=100787 RepID=A0A0G4NKY1_VERLO|nr:hypothetical protein BN1723_007304 [Verticillium longisporum]
MRNPLSAIIHCSDAIIASLAKGQELLEHGPRSPRSPRSASSATDSHGDGQVDLSQLIADSIDNAETIVACAQHQKRIVDDILTMSKLDSKLLAVTPCTVNPVLIGQEALRMFDVEARRVDIDLTMTVDQSYKDLGYEYLDLDPSRVKQVLINLLTNALKFTKSGSTRNVSVSMKGSREKPTNETSPVTFIPRSCEEDSEYEQPALEGRDNPVYLIFEVKDTGQGLSAAEKANLFNRFVQASSRTHVKYGGSGLGLFISRRLTELQRGAIGVSSLPGVGSTFAFYIESYVPTEEARQEAEFATDAARTSPLTFGAPSPGQPAAGHGVTKARTPSVNQRLKRQVGNQRDRRLDGILVVEDNLINQQITRRGLHDRGFRVDVANHGLEALEKLAESVAQRRAQERREEAGGGEGAVKTTTTAEAGSVPLVINLILMDIEMPIQDGLTCTRHIRAMEKEGKVFCGGDGGRIPIIAVSANARPEQMQQAREAGCDDVLVKPYRMPELIEKMHVVFRLSPASLLLVPSSLRGMKLALRRIPHRIPTLSARHHHQQQNQHTSAAHRTNPTASHARSSGHNAIPLPNRLSVRSRTPGTPTHSQPLAARFYFSTSTTRHTSPRQTVTMANRVHRVTMFKLPNKDHQDKLLAAYRTLSAEQKKVRSAVPSRLLSCHGALAYGRVDGREAVHAASNDVSLRNAIPRKKEELNRPQILSVAGRATRQEKQR